jgi:hypothetical protein
MLQFVECVVEILSNYTRANEEKLSALIKL